MYKAIIFDFFGVFGPDVLPVWLQKYGLDTPEHTGYFTDLAKRIDEGRMGKDTFLQTLANKSHTTPEQVEAELNDFVFNDRLISLLPRLRKTYKLALLCNASSQILKPLLVAKDLDKYFDCLIISSDVGMSKTNPDIYRLVLKRLDVQSNEALFIDDRPGNVQGAEAVGIRGILYEGFEEMEAALRQANIVAV
jgi:HAD superfamily hydrolase (TIGR01509 family)